MEKPKRLESQSLDGVQLNLDALYQIAPSCFTEATDPKTGKIKHMVDFNILRQLLGDDAVEDAPEAYQFTWVGKQAARAEMLRPIKKTLRPVKEDSVDWDNTQNLYIEGDNLEVLKLLQKSYLGKVKMIYIDPPYNTGDDYVYHDKFAHSQSEEDLLAGNVDELGNRYIKNTDSNGRFHSDWCSMVYSRLMVARSLLSEDGVLFISIDDNEVDNTRKICDEIFGQRNRLDRGELIWVNRGSTKGFNKIVKNHEYILAYGKNAEIVKSCFGKNRSDELDELEHYCYNKPSPKNPYNDVLFKKGCKIEGVNDIEFVDHVGDEVQLKIVSGRMLFKNGELQDDVVLRGTWPYKNQIEHYFKHLGTDVPTIDVKGQKWIEIFFNRKGLPRYRKERNTQVISSVIDEPNIPNYGSDDIAKLFGKKEVFSFPKPTQLLVHLLSYFADKDAIILDFYSGSATMAQAIFEMNALYGGNRKFVLVQLPEVTSEDSEAYKAGFKNICEIGKERIRRAGKKIKEEHPEAKDLDTGFRVFRVDESNFEDVERTPKDWNQDQLDLFLNNIKRYRSDLDLLFGCMLDWGVQLSLPMSSEVVDGETIYTVNDGDLVACFAEKVTGNVVKAMADKQPLRVIFRDSCFEQDADKINIYETFKQLMDWSDQEVVKNIRVI